MLIILFIILTSHSVMAYKKSETSILIGENINRCQKAGIKYLSPYVNIKQDYFAFRKAYPDCKPFTHKMRGDTKDDHKELLAFAQELSKNTACPIYAQISKKYLKDMRSKESEQLKQSRLLEMLATKEAKQTHIQAETSYLSWGYTICASAQLSDTMYLNAKYKQALITKKYKRDPVEITQNGQEVTDCSNVYAQGSEDLKEFIIDISGATQDSVLTYNTFSVPDRMKVTTDSGIVLLDSGCIGTMKEEKLTIALNPQVHKKLIFEVDAKCDPETYNSGWSMHFTCGQPREESLFDIQDPVFAACKKNAQKVINKLSYNIDLELEAQKALWSRALCQEKNYNFVVDRLSLKSRNRFPKKGNTSGFSVSNYAGSQMVNFKKKSKNVTFRTPSSNNVNTPAFINNKQDFIKNKKRDCPPKPTEADSIFTQISYGYCHHGYQRLLD